MIPASKNNSTSPIACGIQSQREYLRFMFASLGRGGLCRHLNVEKLFWRKKDI